MFLAPEVAVIVISLTNAACCHSGASLESRDVEGVTTKSLFRHHISIYGVAAESFRLQSSYREKTIDLHIHDNCGGRPIYLRTLWSGSTLRLFADEAACRSPTITSQPGQRRFCSQLHRPMVRPALLLTSLKEKLVCRKFVSRF